MCPFLVHVFSLSSAMLSEHKPLPLLSLFLRLSLSNDICVESWDTLPLLTLHNHNVAILDSTSVTFYILFLSFLDCLLVCICLIHPLCAVSRSYRHSLPHYFTLSLITLSVHLVIGQIIPNSLHILWLFAGCLALFKRDKKELNVFLCVCVFVCTVHTRLHKYTTIDTPQSISFLVSNKPLLTPLTKVRFCLCTMSQNMKKMKANS